MKLLVKYDVQSICKKLLQAQLDKMDLQYDMNGSAEIELKDSLTPAQYEQLQQLFSASGIEIVENQKSALVQRIKDLITQIVYVDEELPSTKISCYLSEKLGMSYCYLANLFSELTYSSIENYLIMQKIERAKQLLVVDKLTLTEISYKLNYCNVAHLSSQFKKNTGMTPSAFQRIITLRKNVLHN